VMMSVSNNDAVSLHLLFSDFTIGCVLATGCILGYFPITHLSLRRHLNMSHIEFRRVFYALNYLHRLNVLHLRLALVQLM